MRSLISLLLLTLSVAQKPPVWPGQFEIAFAEQTFTGKTTGKIIYDATNNREVVERATGRFDRYCNTVEKLQNTPCTHIVVDNKRYLDFPAKKYCCYCCDSTHGCGITRQDWLAQANFNGTEKIEGETFEKWEIKGGQQNYYWNSIDSKRVPKRLFQSPNDNMDFNTNSYTLNITDKSVFDLPKYCNQTCGPITICAALRGEKVLHEQTQ